MNYILIIGNYGENEFAGATTGIFYLNDNDSYTFLVLVKRWSLKQTV